MPSGYIPEVSAFRSRRLRGTGQQVALFVLQCALGVAGVLLVAAMAHPMRGMLPAQPLLCLLIVVATALCGLWQALIVSFAAAAGLIGLAAPQQGLANPLPWISLLAFVIAALLVSRASARVAGHARIADSREHQMRDLFEFTRQTLQMNLNVEPGPQLTELIHDIFALEAVALFDADLHQVYQAGYWNQSPQEMAQNVYYFETSDDDPKTGLGRRVVRLGTVPVGSLVVRGETTPLTNNIIASLIAIAFDRYRAFANESRIEMERRTEQLRATVLDSLAHAYKTPLTAIRAASTGLTEMGRLSPGQAELVALINEQTDALGELTTRLLTTARLDAGEVVLHASPVSVGSIIEEVLVTLKDRLASMKVAVDLADENLVLNCDRQLMLMLLTQYVDNACKYSILGTTISIRVMLTRTEAVFSVHSYGPVIPMSDRERIFDRYYRSAKYSNRASGTGIGLSVAKRVAQIHGGQVWVTSEEHEGTTFFAAIPIAREKGSAR